MWLQPLSTFSVEEHDIDEHATPVTACTPQPIQGCILSAPIGTSALVERMLNGQSSRSTQVEERVKKQNRVFCDLAVKVHHGSKVCVW